LNSRYESKRYRNYVLGVLTLVYAVNFIDRQLLSILQESIKVDLGLSDTQLGYLGIAFAIFYVFAGIPIARWADKSNRRNIISLSIAGWSVMTVLTGAVQNFGQLLAARIGVGVGEAGCSPPAHSIITDMYPPERRATALSTYSVGINIGIMFGILLGGVINQYFGWRWAFLVVGAPGILIALFFRFTVDEPPRGFSERKNVATDSASESVPEAVSFSRVLKFIAERKYLVHLSIASGLSALAGYGLTSWIASFFIRSHGMGDETAILGLWLSIGAGVFGGMGTFGFGYISDKFGKKDKRWYMWMPAIAILTCLPLTAITLLLEDRSAALWMQLLPSIFTTGYLGAALSVFHGAVEPRMRATASALFFLILNLIGLGFGTFIIGFVSDALAPQFGVESLRYSMLIVVSIACVWSALHFVLGARDIKTRGLN
jgi:predicted MFS family arabinose efflux permease